MSKQDNIKEALEGKDLEFVGKYEDFTQYESGKGFECPCGTRSCKGYKFQDKDTGEILLVASYCAKRYLSHLLPKTKKGRRLKLSDEFLRSFRKGTNEG